MGAWASRERSEEWEAGKPHDLPEELQQFLAKQLEQSRAELHKRMNAEHQFLGLGNAAHPNWTARCKCGWQTKCRSRNKAERILYAHMHEANAADR